MLLIALNIAFAILLAYWSYGHYMEGRKVWCYLYIAGSVFNIIVALNALLK